MKKRRILFAAAAAALCAVMVMGCGKSTEPPKVTVTELWSLQDAEAINNPESAWYDDANNCIWVVNTTDAASPNSFVSVLNTDGTVANPMFAGGFTALRGTCVADGFLYTNQLDCLTKIELATGKTVATYPAPGAMALNDVTMDKDGNLYSTDAQNNAIFVLEGEKMVPFVTGEETEWPNGALCIGDTMYITPWGIGDLSTWEVDYASSVKTIDLKTKEIKALGSADKIGSLDGVEKYDDNNILVNNWWEGKVYLVNLKSGKSSLILDIGLASVGDINYNAKTKTLVVPVGNAAGDQSHQIKAYKIEG